MLDHRVVSPEEPDTSPRGTELPDASEGDRTTEGYGPFSFQRTDCAAIDLGAACFDVVGGGLLETDTGSGQVLDLALLHDDHLPLDTLGVYAGGTCRFGGNISAGLPVVRVVDAWLLCVVHRSNPFARRGLLV